MKTANKVKKLMLCPRRFYPVLLVVLIFCPAVAAAAQQVSPQGNTEDTEWEKPAARSLECFDPDKVRLTRMELKGLVQIDKGMDPLKLDADVPRQISLREILLIAMERNLDIGITSLDKSISRWNYAGSIGKFLPTVRLGFLYQYLTGKLNLPIGQNPDPIRFDNPFIFTRAGVSYYAYRGGSVVFGALRERNRMRAAGHAQRTTISDVFRDAADRYYRLILEEAILRIRIKAVEVSQEQVDQTKAKLEAGSATRLDVLQAENQLSQDKQNLIDQQVARRVASIELSDFLNIPQNVDLVPVTLTLEKNRLVASKATLNKLLSTALSHRPELKELAELRLAARKDIVVKTAPLQPTLELGTNVFGLGETLGNSSDTVTVLAPITLASGTTTLAPTKRRVSKQISALYTLGLNLNWSFEGLGTTDMAKIQAAKLEARKVHLQHNKEVNRVISEVRQAYLNSFRTERKLEEALCQLRSADEELRISKLRFENGFGLNLDILRAQHDYTDALIQKARALVDFNIAQVNLVRSVGTVSVDTLTSQKALPAP